MGSPATTMDVDSGSDESKVAFPVIQGHQLQQWRNHIRDRYQLNSENIYVFEDPGIDLDFTIVTAPPSYHQSLATRDSDKEVESSDNSAYILSSKRLIKWFPSWRDVLAGVLRTTPKGSMGIVQMPVDNSGLFNVFIGLAHGHQVDFDCSAPMLSEIAVYCKTHGLEGLAGPKIDNWIKTARYFSPLESDPTMYRTDWDWLVIGYEFGKAQIFRKAWLRLAYKVSKSDLQLYYPNSMHSLLSKVRDAILKSRTGFLEYAIGDLIRHYERANVLLRPGSLPDCEVCRTGEQTCVLAQFEQIDRWLAKTFMPHNLRESRTMTYYDAFRGSPCDLFAENKLELSHMCDECERRGLLRRILSRLENDIGTVLGEFLTSSPYHGPMTHEHVEYMEEREEEIDTAGS